MGNHVGLGSDGSSSESVGSSSTGNTELSTGMYVWGGVREPDSFWPQWVVPSSVEDDWCLKVGSMKSTDATYDGIVAMIWDTIWDIPEDEYLLD